MPRWLPMLFGHVRAGRDELGLMAMKWQPIETAPKDNIESCILIACNRDGNYECRVAFYEVDADPTYPWHVEDAAKGFNIHKDWPTHWMALPMAPPDVLDGFAYGADGC